MYYFPILNRGGENAARTARVIKAVAMRMTGSNKNFTVLHFIFCLLPLRFVHIFAR